MIEFEFELMPLDDIQPWETPGTGEKCLSWFGLSYGYYRIRVGSEYLLNYDNRVDITIGGRPPPKRTRTWVDYQIARFWDDVLSMLPSVMASAPAEISTLLERDRDEIASYRRRIDRWEEKGGEDQAENNYRQGLADIALDWFHLFTLDSGYLRPLSEIWLWSGDDTVNIAWDNRGLEIRGQPAWSAQRGTYRVTRSEYLAAVSSFSERFLTEMEERVATVCNHWNRPDVAIDRKQLASGQQRSVEWAQQMLSLPTALTPDWDEVCKAMRNIPVS